MSAPAFLPRAGAALASSLLAAATASAATGIDLPSWSCAHPDAIYASAFDADEALVPLDPSLGSGGFYPGNSTRTVFVAHFGSHDYYVHAPKGYTPQRPWPLLLVLEGAAGSVTGAINQAQTMRTDWKALADAQGFIVAAPVASGSNGGWIEPTVDGTGPSDYDVLAAIVADLEAAYNVERTRRYAWGYSAGGEVLHDIMLTGWSGMSADTFAGYAVTGAVLAGCPDYQASIQPCVPSHATRAIPLDIHLGINDPYIPLSYAQSDVVAFAAAGWELGNTLFYTEFSDGSPAGGHTFSAADLSQAWHNLCPHAVIP
jgi:poly(3-hydroxybutyrate) depolymerase